MIKLISFVKKLKKQNTLSVLLLMVLGANSFQPQISRSNWHFFCLSFLVLLSASINIADDCWSQYMNVTDVKGSEILCRIYSLDLVTWKIVCVKIWYFGIHNQVNLVNDCLKIDQYLPILCGQFFTRKIKNKNST